MTALLLMWAAAGIFALFICWGINVPVRRNSLVTYWGAGLILLFNIFSQTAFFQVDLNSFIGQSNQPVILENSSAGQILRRLSFQPEGLLGSAPDHWYRLITSSMLHYGWLPLIFHLWFIVLFGHVIEGYLGRWKLLLAFGAGLIVPAALDGFLPPVLPSLRGHYLGGSSGLVYTLAGVSLVSFFRARCHVAFNWDGRFWGLTLCIFLPLTIATYRAGLALTEMIMLVGMATAFVVIQPDHRDLKLPLLWIVGGKIVQDVVFISPVTHHVLSNSPWRICGGLVLGGMLGFAFSGVAGIRQEFEAAPAAPLKKRGGLNTKEALAKFEEAGRDNEDAARKYLGQRVFVGDGVRASKFYRDVIMPLFPQITLPLRDQLALARMLHGRAHDEEALHAYKNFLTNYEVDDDHWDVWMTAGELALKVKPAQRDTARAWFEKFLESPTILMRDRLEAERLLGELGAASEDPTAETSCSAAADEAPQTSADLSADEPPGEAPGLDFPRMVPRSFRIENGMATGPPQRSTVRNTGQFEDTEAQKFWQPLELKSGGRIDDEEILLLRSCKISGPPPEVLSGQYGAARQTDLEMEATDQSARRMSHLEAVTQKLMRPGLQPPYAGAGADKYGGGTGDVELANRAPGADPLRDADRRSGISGNYAGAEAASADVQRPIIKLRREVRA